MNLVAKEFVSSRFDEKGALVLSEFTGASRELTDAILINPYDRDNFADGIYTALTLSEEEATKRMAKMRGHIQLNNIFRWAGRIVSDLLRFDFSED
jgi:trehalose 6-phosphate synthase